MFEKGRVNIVSLFGFLETDIRERQKYKKGIQSSVDNTVNAENCVKDKNQKGDFTSSTVTFCHKFLMF